MNGIEYIQFKRLLKFPELKHAYIDEAEKDNVKYSGVTLFTINDIREKRN